MTDPMRGSPGLHRALEVLADGQWHDMAEVVLEVMAVIPPARAIRDTEYSRQMSAKGVGREPGARKQPRTNGQLVEIGARQSANQLLSNGRRFQIQWLRPDGGWADSPKGIKRGMRRRIRLDPNYVYGSTDPRQVGRTRKR